MKLTVTNKMTGEMRSFENLADAAEYLSMPEARLYRLVVHHEKTFEYENWKIYV